LKNPENVRWVSIDLCDPYKRFVSDYLPRLAETAEQTVVRVAQKQQLKVLVPLFRAIG
jgi:hypothetical protein